MKQLRILFTCVGRRVELIQAFHNAADNLSIPLQIWGTDSAKTAPALLFCDRISIVCKIKEPNYISQLLSICEREKIDALIPTIDTDLIVLSQNIERFSCLGTKVILSNVNVIEICRNKILTTDFFTRIGLKSPRIVDDYTKYDDGYPAFIKPKDGSSSEFAHRINNSHELISYSNQVPNYIIQQFIEGVEYTVDIMCDFEGKPIYITPRIRLAVRSGEVIKTEIVDDRIIVEEVKELLKCLKPCGPITVQLIRQNVSGMDYFIEINPRFGGGVPLSIKAGANSAEVLLRLLNNEELFFIENAANEHDIYSRFDQSVCVNRMILSTKAVIFDLDDTLYLEKDYVRSGYNAVSELLSFIPDINSKLWRAFEEGKNAIDCVLTDEGIFSEETKNNCLQAYRSHLPNLTLSKKVEKMLVSLRERKIKIGIITDGRPEGQWNKIKALGLIKLVNEIIVTDEIGGIEFRKPNDISFRIMQRKMNIPFTQMMYVGDNPLKDFIAPRQLGMQTVFFNNVEGLYSTNTNANDIVTISDIVDLIGLL